MRLLATLVATLALASAAYGQVSGDKSHLPGRVTGFQGRPLDPAAPSINDALFWNGTKWTHGQPWTGGPVVVPVVNPYATPETAGCAPNAPGTDISACLQAWINATAAQGRVCFWDAQYFVSATLNDDVGCRMLGATRVSGPAQNAGMAAPLMTINTVSYLDIETMQFDCTANVIAYCVTIARASVADLRHVRIASAGGALQTGTPGEPSWVANFNFEDLDFGGCGGGFVVDIYSPGDSFMQHGHVNGCASTQAAIHTSANQGLHIGSLKITNSQRGIWLQNPVDSDFFILGNSIEGEALTGIEIDGNGAGTTAFNNMLINGNQITGPAQPILFGDPTAVNLGNAEIVGNTLQCTGSGNAAVTIAAGSGFQIGGNLTAGCVQAVSGGTNVHTF